MYPTATRRGPDREPAPITDRAHPTPSSSARRTATPAAAHPRDAGAALWHLGWGLAVGAMLAAGLSGLLPMSVGQTSALVLALVPAVAGQGLWFAGGERQRAGILLAWAAVAAISLLPSGGLAGPFAAWSLAPLAAGVRLGGPRLAAAGAAGTLLALAVGLAVALTGGEPTPAPLLAFAAGATLVAALAAAVLGVLGAGAATVERETAMRVRLEQLLAEQPWLTVTLDHDGRVLAAYGAAPPGTPAEVLLAQGLPATVHPPDRQAVLAALARAAGSGSAEVGFTPRGALDRHTVVALRRMPDGRLAGVLRDNSVAHAREAALDAARAEAESLHAGKSRFLANMSHELRTPLNAVLGFSDIMRQRMFGPLSDKYLEYANLIHDAGGHLLDLINDVLDMSKIEAERYELSRERFDAREPVSAALRLVRLQAHEKEIDLRGVLPGEPAVVEADKRAIKQITLNLLSNALKFTPARGSVTVTLEARGPVLELVVSDTGMGIAPDDIERLGRPYEQAGDAGQRAQGTGLGLSLVRALAELHGGRMSIESTLGEGAAFTVRLPVIAERPSATVIPFAPAG